jgi:DNA primase
MMNDECSQPEQMSMRSKSFAKTSGSKGLQVYLPLNTSVTYDETKKLFRALAEYLEGEHVDRVTSNPLASAVTATRGSLVLDIRTESVHTRIVL